MLLLEGQHLSGSQKDHLTPATGYQIPPHYFLPETLRNWPWQRSINPHYHSCKAECMAWFESFKPSPKVKAAFDEGDYSLLAALTFPRGSHFNLRSCCDMMYTFFMVDDHTTNLPIDVVVERCEATRDAILHVDKPRPEGEHIIGEITRQFWKRASSDMPRAVVERFEKSWHNYIDAVILQNYHRFQDYVCAPEEYMAIRCDNVGAFPCLALLEQTLELDLPHEIMDHPYVQSLNKYACEMIFLDNDMISYKKEFLTDDADYNTITVVQKHLGRDLESALKWLSDYYDQNIDKFLALREKVLKKDGFPSLGPRIDREVADYVVGLGLWVRHNEWNFGSRRYLGDYGLEIQKHRKVVLA